MTLRIDLDELGPWQSECLSSAQGRALRDSGLVEAKVDDDRPGHWSVRAAGQVGVAQVAGVEVWVRPKVRIDRLFFMLGYALNPIGWRDDLAGLEERPDLVPVLAQAFARQAERALRQGVLQGYRVAEEASPVLRGRLREADQLRQRFGMPLPVEIRFDEFGTDIAENQVLRAALLRLLRVPTVDASTRRRLLHASRRLADVSPLVSGQELPRWQPSRLNARYQSVLRLADVILRRGSVEHAPGAVPVDGFMINMWKLFEDFVTVAVGEVLQRHGGKAHRQAKHWLDLDARIRFKPDLVWIQSGVPMAVVDAKYKAEKPEGFPDADIYQVLAYCTALKLRRGHLVYAKGNEPAATHTIRNCGIEIVCHAIDLDTTPEDLLHRVGQIALDVASDNALTAFAQPRS